jgi:hypothetical protein
MVLRGVVYEINKGGPRTKNRTLWDTIQKPINRRIRITNLDVEIPRVRDIK